MFPERFTLPLPEKRPNLQYSSVDCAVSVYGRPEFEPVFEPATFRSRIRRTTIEPPRHRVQLSQPCVATGHTGAFIRRVFVVIGMLWLFHIFCSDAPIACPLFNLVWNSVVHSPSSVIRDPRYGNVSSCSSSSFWMSTRHAMPSLAITLVLSTLISRLYLRLTRSRQSTNSYSSASEVANKMMSSA